MIRAYDWVQSCSDGILARPLIRFQQLLEHVRSAHLETSYFMVTEGILKPPLE